MDLSILATITGLSSILTDVVARHARFMDFSKYATPLLCLTSGSPFVWAKCCGGILLLTTLKKTPRRGQALPFYPRFSIRLSVVASWAAKPASLHCVIAPLGT